MAEGVTKEGNELQNNVSSTTSDDSKSSSAVSLLLVVGEPFNHDYIPAIVDRIVTGWSSCHCSLSNIDVGHLLGSLSSQQPIVNKGTSDDVVLDWKGENFNVRVLIYPSSKQVLRSIREFLTSNTVYRSLTYAGHTVVGNGNWLLHDGSLSYAEIAGAFKADHNIVGETEISTFAEGDWTDAHVSAWLKGSKVRLATVKKDDAENSEIRGFVESMIAPHITAKSIGEMLPTSNVVGVVPFQRPTVYLFQGGDGVSTVFGVRGFTLLVDGGYAKKTTCWDFIRHLDRIDALLISHLGVDNLLGMTSFIERYSAGDVPTSVGVVYFNAGSVPPAANKGSGDHGAIDPATKENGKDIKELPLSLSHQGVSVLEKLNQLSIPVLPCTTSVGGQPINLYHKIGFGSLDMYVLNPVSDSKELKDFYSSWIKRGKTSPAEVNLSNQACVAAVVVFKPATNSDKPVRILFPGSASQSKLFEGLDRLKNVALFQDIPPVKTAARPVSSSVDKSVNRSVVTAARPATAGSAKPTNTKPASAPSAPKTESKEVKRPADKKPQATDVKKVGDSKDIKQEVKSVTRSVTEPKKEKTEAKDSRAQLPLTSTPKKDSPKPAPVKLDAVKKNGTAAPAGGPGPKKVDESSKKSTAKAVNSSKSAGKKEPAKPTSEKIPAQVASDDKKAAEEETVKLEDVSLTEKQPVESAPVGVVDGDGGNAVVEDSQIQNQEQVIIENIDVDTTQPTVTSITSAAAAAETQSVDDGRAVQSDEVAGVPPPVVDPIGQWDPPQSLPRPADDKNDIVEASSTHPLPSSSGDTAVDNQQPASAAEIPPNQETLKIGSETAKSGPAQKTKQSATSNKQTKTGPHPQSSKQDPVTSVTGHPSGSAVKKSASVKPVVPFYVDLAYIPVNAASICDADFFRRVRAKRYVLPGAEASCRTMSLLIDAKASWEGAVSVIPTGDVESLTSWMNAHREELFALQISVEPSVTSCTMSLEQATSCSAFRIEL